ncbi:anti-sigma factor family protein [Candidatus Zixiibacteriota bacterium]
MKCDGVQQLLDDFVDGILSGGVHSRLERHLATCEECRRSLAELQALLDDAADLPAEIRPSKDLWPAVRSQIELEESVPSRHSFFNRPKYMLAAAALFVLVTAGSLMIPRMIEMGMGSIEWMMTEWQIGQVTTAAMERQYLGAIEELSYVVAERRATVPQSALKIIDQNLRVLDNAIEESRTALWNNPSDRELQSTLSTVYQQKVELLQWTAQITTSNE